MGIAASVTYLIEQYVAYSNRKELNRGNQPQGTLIELARVWFSLASIRLYRDISGYGRPNNLAGHRCLLISVVVRRMRSSFRLQ
jgi:hypothetical protein